MNDQLRTEQIILLALFKCTNEQATFLIGKYKHKLKHDFNVWLNQGFKMLSELERTNPDQAADIEAVTDQLHNIIQIAKNQTNN
jgi:hypothetical protein